MREKLINDGIEKANLYIESKTALSETNVKMEIIEKQTRFPIIKEIFQGII